MQDERECAVSTQRSYIILMLVIPCALFFYGLGTVDLASNILHVLFGTLLLLYSLKKTIEVAGKVKYWAVLPLALLVRQFFFVILPIALTLHMQDQYRAGSWYFDTLFEGGLIITIENYAFFFVLYLWMKRSSLGTKVKGTDAGLFLFCAGLTIMVVGIITRIAFYYGFSDFLGQSATKYWFGLGFTLLIVLLLQKKQGTFSPYVGIALAIGLACLVAIPLAGTGSRSLLLTPFFCLLGAYSCFRLETFTLPKIAAGVLIAMVFAVVAFSIVAGVRYTFYGTGNVGSFEDVQKSASVDPTEGLQATLYRLGATAASAEIVASSPGSIPQRKVSNVIALFAGSLISKNLWNIERSLGMSYKTGDSMPGEVVAGIMGIDGSAAFPLSSDLYLIGGYGAVALGTAMAGVIAVFLLRCLKRLIRNETILVALLAGVFFPGFAILETATELASMLLWNMWMLMLLCFVLQEIETILTPRPKKDRISIVHSDLPRLTTSHLKDA